MPSLAQGTIEMKQVKFKKGDRKQVNFYYSKSEYKKFVERFPNMTSWYLSSCLRRATYETNFLNSVLSGVELNG